MVRDEVTPPDPDLASTASGWGRARRIAFYAVIALLLANIGASSGRSLFDATTPAKDMRAREASRRRRHIRPRAALLRGHRATRARPQTISPRLGAEARSADGSDLAQLAE